MYYPFILIWHCSVACIVKSQAFSLRRQEQVCLRRHTQRHGVRSTLQRCMKHAHIITHSSTHAVCLLFFTRKWGAWPTTFWLTPDKVAEEFSVCCHCYRTVSYGIAISPPKFNYHLRLLVANTPPLFCSCCLCVCACVLPSDLSMLFSFPIFSYLSRQCTQIHVITGQKHLADIGWSYAILRERRKTPPSWHRKPWVIDHVI